MKSVYTDKYAEMQYTIHALKTVWNLSEEGWTLYTLNERHVGDVAEV